MAPRAATPKTASASSAAPAASTAAAPAAAAAASASATKPPTSKVAATKTAAAASSPVAASASAAVPAAASAVKGATATEADADVKTVSPFEEVAAKIVAVSAILKELQAMLKVISKDHDKLKKTVDKSERKRANARSNPNGFAKPTKIVDELCDFCGVARGTLMSRTDVTRHINSYIKDKNLNKPENKRIILPDAKLHALLKLKEGDEVNYFRLQSLLSILFIKDTPAAVAVAAA